MTIAGNASEYKQNNNLQALMAKEAVQAFKHHNVTYPTPVGLAGSAQISTAEKRVGEVTNNILEIDRQLDYLSVRLNYFIDLVQPCMRPADSICAGSNIQGKPDITIIGGHLSNIISRLSNLTEQVNDNIERCEI